MELKFIAFYDIANQGIWLQIFIIELCVVNGLKDLWRLMVTKPQNFIQRTTEDCQNKIKKEKCIDIKFLVDK